MRLLESYAPGPLEVLIFTFGLYCLLAWAGLIKGIPLGKFALTPPSSTKGKAILGALGIGLLAWSTALSLQKPVWRPAVSRELLYRGEGDARADQIVADGERLYVLTRVGNIARVLDNETEMVDEGTNTKRIAAAGGLLYVLKNSGRIWTILLSERREYREIDPGVNTAQIVAVGEALYVLKDKGEVWRVWVSFDSDAQGGLLEREYTRLPALDDIAQIASSGTLLFMRKRNGDVYRYFPMPESASGYQHMAGCGKAAGIAADGGTLYLIDRDGKAFMCRGGKRTPVFARAIVETIDAQGGVAYLVTNEGELWRYDALTQRLRRLSKPLEGDASIKTIAAYNHGCFVVSEDGTVWRYSEFLRKL